MEYIIISLKHSTPKQAIYWRANNEGYTYSPFAAGKYTEQQVMADPAYYNDGLENVAIALTDAAMSEIEFQSKISFAAVVEYHQKNKHHLLNSKS